MLCFLPPTGPKRRLANFYKVFFLPPESTIHLYLSGKGRIMINSSARLTKPYSDGCLLFLSYSCSCPLSISRLPGTVNLFINIFAQLSIILLILPSHVSLQGFDYPKSLLKSLTFLSHCASFTVYIGFTSLQLHICQLDCVCKLGV